LICALRRPGRTGRYERVPADKFGPGIYIARLYTIRAMPSTALKSSPDTSRSLQIALAAAKTAADNRATGVAVLDLREMTPLFDYFVLATGTSRRQLHAISEDIDRVLEGEWGETREGIEGYRESRWILLDYGNVVVHLFDQETRDYYALEQLWSGAKAVELPAELLTARK